MQNIEESGVSVREDLQHIRAGLWSESTLLSHCLDGADEDREQGWIEYVDALFASV
jgi:hypothetical protein